MNVNLIDTQNLNQITEGDRQRILITYLQTQIAKLIGVEPGDIEAQQSLQYLGIDSLIAAKLRNCLRSDLLVDVSAVEFLTDTTLADLVELVDRLLTQPPQANVANSLAQAQNLWAEQLEQPDSCPLSYGQQGLWFLYQLALQSAAYNLAFTARITSYLDVAALQRAVNQLVERHQSLRTIFDQQDQEPFQSVCQQQVNIRQIDASTWSEAKLRHEAIAAHETPFDLTADSLLRVDLFTCSDQDHLLLLGIHHIAVDGYSFGIILDELRQLYKSAITGQQISLPKIQRQYSSFVQGQQQMLVSPEGEAHRNYWHKKLEGELPLLNLPVDHWRSPDSDHTPGFYQFELEPLLAQQLRAMAQTKGVTLYMILLASFQVLLHRYTGQEDIIIGSPSEGRSQAELVGTVGFFINMISLREQVKSELTFDQLLVQVKQTVLEALSHQEYPSALLIKSLQLNQDASLAGLFQVVFNLLKLQDLGADYELSVTTAAPIRENWGGLILEPYVIPQQQGQFDEGQYSLGLDIVEASQSTWGIFRYDAGLFDHSTIVRMAEHLENLLGAIITDSSQAIARLSMLGTSERQQLAAWGQDFQESDDTNLKVVETLQGGIHQLFETQAKKTPDALALSFMGASLTYRQLNERANQLAHYFQQRGVSSEVLVGICLERSLEMVISLLAVLKAGGAYLPLDPAYPAERLSFILADAQISFLLTQSELSPVLSVQSAVIILLNEESQLIAQQSKVNPPALGKTDSLDNLAYVIYTSGSTGQAKGVQVVHRNLLNAYKGWSTAYQLDDLTSHLQMASFSFDVFSGDWIRALCSGAKLELCPRNLLLEPAKLYQLMVEAKIDSAEFVPAVLKNLVQYLTDTQQNLQFMKLLVVGSDVLHVREFEQFRQVCGAETRLINSYGVTEATIDSTYFEATTLSLSADGAVPIGIPFNQVQIQILDAQLQPRGIGMPGELYLGGLGISRGYLNRPGLTREKFIAHPFKPEQRLYKTGDLARYLPDGNLEFLGRIDHQVKVRGFRIELGEVEAALVSQPQVKSAVVIPRTDQGKSKYLAAYIVPGSRTDSTTFCNSNELRDSLKQFLKQKLPEYMIPTAFVFLETLPLTANGKVERRTLPMPDLTQDRLETFVAPRTSEEAAIAKVFSSVLKLERIGINDNFFELGGHSLLATQVISRLRQTFGLEFPLRSLLDDPTVAGLEKTRKQLSLVRSASDKSGKSIQTPCTISNYLVPIQTQGSQPPLFCIHPAGGQVMAYKNIANYWQGDRPIYGIQSRAINNPSLEHQSLTEMATEYTQAIRQQQPTGAYHLLGWSMGGVVAMDIAQQLEHQGQEVAFLGLLDAFLLSEKSLSSAPDPDPLLEFLPILGHKFIQGVQSVEPKKQQQQRDSLRDLESGDRLEQILTWGEGQNLLDSHLTKDIWHQQYTLTKIHQKLLQNHQPPQVQTGLHIWWANEQLGLAIPRPNWGKHTAGGTRVKEVRGNHFSLMDNPAVEILAQDLAVCLSALTTAKA